MGLVFSHLCFLNLEGMETLNVVSRQTDQVSGKGAEGGWEEPRSVWGAFIRFSSRSRFPALPTSSETESGLFPPIMVKPSLTFPTFHSISIQFYPSHNLGRLDRTQDSLAPFDRWRNRGSKRVNAETVRLGHGRATSSPPRAPDSKPQTPPFSRERGPKVWGVYTHSPPKECRVLWLGFFFPCLSSLRMPAKGVRLCVGGGRGWVAELHVVPKPLYKGGQSTEPAWDEVHKSLPDFCCLIRAELPQGNDSERDSTCRWELGSVPHAVAPWVAYCDLHVCFKFIKHPLVATEIDKLLLGLETNWERWSPCNLWHCASQCEVSFVRD